MNESSSPAPAPVSPLWTRDFTIITLGSVISMLGNSMSGFALSLLVLDYTGSNLLYAIYIATFTLPQIVMPIFSGAILDRFSRKKTIYTLDFLSSGVYLVAALILSRGWFSFPMLAVFCFIIGSINSIYYVAYDSFYPLLISEGNYSKAYSIASVLETLSALIIPIATYFYNLFGIAPLLGINALCFFIAATAETQIRAEEHYIAKQRDALALEEQRSSGRQLLRDIKEGFQYLMGEKGLLRVVIYFTFSMLASGASQVITLPYFKSTFSNGEYIYMLVWGMAIFGRAIGGGIHYRVKLPVQHKYLIALPTLQTLEQTYHAASIDMMQTYLTRANPSIVRRVRQQKNGGDYLYFYTEKRTTGSGQWETEKPISEKEYIRYLMEGDTSLHTVHKTKYRFVYNGCRFEIDVYPFSQDRAIMRAALPENAPVLTAPPEITVLREVTGDPAYKNRQLAKNQRL